MKTLSYIKITNLPLACVRNENTIQHKRDIHAVTIVTRFLMVYLDIVKCPENGRAFIAVNVVLGSQHRYYYNYYLLKPPLSEYRYIICMLGNQHIHAGFTHLRTGHVQVRVWVTMCVRARARARVCV